MNIIAVANISDGTNTIGFRLLDAESKQVKDVPIANIIEILKENKVTISNLMYSNNNVVGSNGSIDRLPKIVNNKLIGKSPLIVISRVGNTEYRVADFKGNIKIMNNKNILEYARLNGISNGKINSKDGKEFISSISGSYTIEEKSLLDSEELYLGELITDSEPLLPVVRLNTLFNLSNIDNIPYNTLTHYYNGKIVVNGADNFLRYFKPDMLTYNQVYQTDKYTVCDRIFVKVRIGNEEDRSLIENILARKGTIERINDMLERMEQRRPSGRRDQLTGIIKPTKQLRYSTLIVEEEINIQFRDYAYIDMIETEKYIDILKAMENNIYVCIRLRTNKVALARRASKKGIDYSVIDTRSIKKMERVNLEEIYETADEYDNVTVDKDIMTIRGLDGVYRYEMDTVYEVYKRYKVDSVTNAKAALVDPTYEEVVEANGDLKRLYGSLKVLKIPDNVNRIVEGSIQASNKTEAIILGENVKQCSARALCKEGSIPGLKYIEIGCNKRAGLGILKSLENFNDFKAGVIELKYTREISPEEYFFILYAEYRRFEVGNLEKMDDEFIFRVVQLIIEKRLDGLKNVKNCSIDMYSEYGDEYKRLMRIWASKFMGKASEELTEKVTVLFKGVGRLLGFEV